MCCDANQVVFTAGICFNTVTYHRNKITKIISFRNYSVNGTINIVMDLCERLNPTRSTTSCSC